MYWSLEAETLITKERLHQRKKKKERWPLLRSPARAREKKFGFAFFFYSFVPVRMFVSLCVCMCN